MTPVPIRAAPAKSEKSKEKFPDLCGRAVAQSRQVRNQPGVPKQNRDGEIRRNRKHVTHQCAAEILPDPPVVWYRCHISRHPESADVDTGENCGATHRKAFHRFRGTIERGTLFLAEQV